jgi:hypothetical protein
MRLLPRPRSGRLCALAAACACALAAQAAGTSAFTGIWRAQGADCGSSTCTSQQIRLGAFQRWTLAAKLQVQGTRVCGQYQSEGAKLFSYLLVGEMRDGQVIAALGQETSSDPAFFDRDDYAKVPAFRRGRLLQLAIEGGRLHVQLLQDDGKPAPQAWTLSRLSANPRSHVAGLFDPALPWEGQFMQACLAHANPAIEAAVRALPAQYKATTR